jgi:hypothetical protein
MGVCRVNCEDCGMVAILAAGFLLWMVLGGIVAIIVCPLLKVPEEREEAPRKAA